MLLRLRAGEGMAHWEMGENIAGFLAAGGDAGAMEAAARFFHMLARQQCQTGQPELARESIKRAVTAWPE